MIHFTSGSPNLNCRCERIIETFKLECLNKLIVYYNTKRSHMERDHLTPIREASEEVKTILIDKIEVREYVGGYQVVRAEGDLILTHPLLFLLDHLLLQVR